MLNFNFANDSKMTAAEHEQPCAEFAANCYAELGKIEFPKPVSAI